MADIVAMVKMRSGLFLNVLIVWVIHFGLLTCSIRRVGLITKPMEEYVNTQTHFVCILFSILLKIFIVLFLHIF
jgi:hypothetical protein